MAQQQAEKKPFERLPVDVVPINYKVELKPDLQAFTFQGKLEITVKVSKATRVVVMNCAEIEIQSAKCAQGDLTATVSFNTEEETVKLEFPSELAAGEATLVLEYTGTLNDQMRGFYRSKYTDSNAPGVEKYAATTQFEAADARRALPCWDEPAHKATFDVILVVPKDRVALSNMNEVSCEELDGGLKKVTFARTPIMSVYLLAFIVGEYDFVEATDANGVKIRVYTPVGKAEDGKFALDVAVKTLPFYNDYFKIAYPLPKMDLIAIQDFAAGAMENWGLVTYRERLLLVNPSSSTATKQLVALVVGHELAHQWFGNLVTMEWWTHLWLNEGFATWIEYLCVDHTHPEYEIWTNFLSREYASAMSLDALASSHPIEVPVGPPSEVEEIFDAISYCKGSCVIRMLHEWIGQESFRNGLNTYLTSFSYKNAFTEDLWAHLEKASQKPVADVMSTWTKQLGYPVISVEGKQEGDNRVLTLSQKKFCGDGNISGFESMLWKVPITVATKGNPQAAKLVLSQQSTTVTLEGVGENDWVLVNPQRVGFYRVAYSSDLFSNLTPALSSHTLSAQDRLGLQNDAFALARAGVGSTVDVLNLFASYSSETSYTVWESLAGNLSTISRLLSHTDYYTSFKAFAERIFEKSVQRLGWESKDTDTPLDAMLRSVVIAAHGQYGNQATIDEAKARFQKHIDGTSELPSDLKSAVFNMAMANGDETTFDQLVKLHDATDSNEEHVRIYRSLGAGKTEALTKKCLEFAVSDKVRSNDLWSLLYSAGRASPHSRQLVWEFMKEKWEWLKDRYQGSFLLGRIVEVTTSGFVTEEKAKEVEQFFKDNPTPAADRIVKQNCEAIRLNAKWLERDSKAIEEWLKAQ